MEYAFIDSVRVRTSRGSLIDIDIRDMELHEIKGQLVWKYISDDGDLIIPIINIFETRYEEV